MYKNVSLLVVIVEKILLKQEKATMYNLGHKIPVQNILESKK